MTQNHYFIDILIILAAAVVAVPIFNKLKMGSVLGYLIAGAFIGPWGLAIIDEVNEIRHIAEFGVVFLLFVIGIELKPARLWIMRHTVFGLGTAQVMITGAIFVGFAIFLGINTKTAVIIGFGLALSSTAFGLQILTERGELGTPYGRSAFSVLLLQDLAVVPLLTLVSLLTKETPLLEGIEYAVLDAFLVLLAVFLVGRFLLTPLLHQVATSRNSEVFTAAAVLVVLGSAWLMTEVGLSMALGAFIAGLLLADSHYRHQVMADMQPFRGILLGLFFMSVGMSINFGIIENQGLTVIAMVVGLILTKALVLFGLCRLFGINSGNSIRVSLLLAQSGEFAFVLFGLAVTRGIMEIELFQLLALIVALSMATTPLLSFVAARLDRNISMKHHQHDISRAEVPEEKPHVIIAGFGRVGRRVAKVLDSAHISYLGLEINPERVSTARTQGYEVFYGDASRMDVLQAAGSEQAAILIITLDQVETSKRLVNIVRQNYPNMPIFARARDSDHCALLDKSGATKTVSETLEASLQLGASALNECGFENSATDALLQEFRIEYYLQLNEETKENNSDTTP